MATYTNHQNKKLVSSKIPVIIVLLTLFSIQTIALSTEDGVHHFKQLDFLKGHGSSRGYGKTFSYGNDERPEANSAKLRNVREADTQDPNCDIIGNDKLKNGVSVFTFNDTNENVALLWTGDRGQSILALTTEEFYIFAAPSHVWVSKDFGKTFVNMDAKLNGATIRGNNGILRHKTSFDKLILMAYPEGMDPYKSNIYRTTNGGDVFEEVELGFTPEGPLKPNPVHHDWLLAHSPNQDYKLWFSEDFGKTWRIVKENVIEFSWGTSEQKTEELIYMSVMSDGTRLDNPYIELTLTLLRTDPHGKEEKEIKQNIYNFGCQGKFLYAATDKEGTDVKNKTKVLHISTDGGDKWNIAQLPGIFGDMFFAVLDMSEGMIILHVDEAGDTGHGKLYTSDGDGIVFSLSLDKHLFPNNDITTDFYKVLSMRGVYMASQMDKEDGIHTMISFDRAGEWDYVDAPKGSQCKEDVKPCKLQIHSRYSQLKQINVPSIPISIPQAPGLILAHGNVADGLETSDPDVFVSSDGGYNWTKALDGPHQYAITNFGGLIVAVSKSEETTNTIRYSYDEGHCWHEYQFSEEPLVVTGLLPEPSSKSLNVSVWGFGADDRQWRAVTIDFSTVLTADCKLHGGEDSDFVEWLPHENNGKAGCVLGKKEYFRKVKPDSFCRITEEFEVIPSRNEICKCEKVDYECDFGFYREDESDNCQLSPDVDSGSLEICKGGEEDQINTFGYRKIPGDQCEDGYQPTRTVEEINKKCNPSLVESNYMVQQKHASTVASLFVILSVLIIIIITTYYVKSRNLCRRHSHGIYRYSELNQGDNEEQVLDVSPGPDTYHDDSDEDMIG